MLRGPFNASDIQTEDGELRHDWLRTKLVHQLELPWIADWCISVTEFMEDNRPAFRLCPWDDLLQTVRVLAPLASDHKKKADLELPIRLDAKSFKSMGDMRGAITVLQIDAMWLLGGVLNEIEYRKNISDDQYEREWDETHQHVMTRLEAALANVRAAP